MSNFFTRSKYRLRSQSLFNFLEKSWMTKHLVQFIQKSYRWDSYYFNSLVCSKWSWPMAMDDFFCLRLWMKMPINESSSKDKGIYLLIIINFFLLLLFLIVFLMNNYMHVNVQEALNHYMWISS